MIRTPKGENPFGLCWAILVKDVLVVVDAHSKWMEMEIVNVGTTQATVEHLRAMFARFGLSKVMVTDNGTCFTSNEFVEFIRQKHIRHFKTALTTLLLMV